MAGRVSATCMNQPFPSIFKRSNHGCREDKEPRFPCSANLANLQEPYTESIHKQNKYLRGGQSQSALFKNCELLMTHLDLGIRLQRPARQLHALLIRRLDGHALSIGQLERQALRRGRDARHGLELGFQLGDAP